MSKPLKIAYLLNSYPMTSTTFIRREIEALEDLGLDIHRHAVRKWDGELVDQRDVRERQRTRYLLSNNVAGLFIALFLTVLTNPLRLAAALKVWFELVRNSGGNYVRHIAYFMQAVQFYRLTQRESIHHVHVHFATNAATVALLAKLMGGPSYSFTVHGPDELLLPRALSFSLKIQHASFVVAISEFCKNFLLNYAPAGCSEKILVARCGLALEEFPLGNTSLKANQTLICVGRLCDQKGQILIPKAAARLRSQFPAIKIVLIGDGDIRGALEQQIKLHGVEDVVELRGWVENLAVLRMVGSSRALLLPSYAEGLPVVIMEALAMGTPVISTTIAGIPELVDEDCGWLFPAGDEAELVRAMQAALACSPDALKTMAAAGQKRVVALHDRRQLAGILSRQFENALIGA